MLILGKLFQMRNHANPDEEKPFLEHLEDLRGSLTKIVLVIIVGFVGCIFFRNDLMAIMRKPIDGVWQLQLSTALHDLPNEVNNDTWEKAAKASRDSTSLSPEQRTFFFDTVSGGDPEFSFHADAITYFRTALLVEDYKARVAYIEGLPGIDQSMREQIKAMLKYHKESKGQGPDPDADSRKRTVFMQSLHPTEGFMLSFKLSLYAGIAVTFPFLLYFILQFIIPGLHKKERKAVFPALAIGFGLFLSGVIFAYALVLPRVLEFFTSYDSGMGITNDWRIGEYISFATQFVLIFGLAFELPVVVMTLVVIGILEHSVMAKSRSYAIVAIFVVAAIITPTPDAMTLFLLAGPMYFLYELCIWLSWFVERRQKKREKIEKEAEIEEENKRLEEFVQTIEKEEQQKKLAVSAPSHLLEHDLDEVADDVDVESLEGNGEPTDLDAEEREAGDDSEEREAGDDSEESDRS